VIRRGQLAVLGWDWRGGQALWPITGRVSAAGESHVAATQNEGGDLVLYVDGHVVRVWERASLVAGRERQRLVVGAPVRFYGEVIPGWPGASPEVTLHDHALELADVAERARTSLNLPQPIVEARAPGTPEPAGCDTPAHLSAWRPDGDRLRCLECVPPRGCDNDDHEPYWRPGGHDMRVTAEWYRLECSLCETAARSVA
jgi:hypothetical protein